MKPDASTDKSAYFGRAAVFVILVAFMTYGPFHRQVLNIREPLFRTWTMFSGIGVGVVDVRFYRESPDGRRELLDRYELLGYENRRDAPRSVYRLRGRGRAADLGRELCAHLGHEADVRVVSRIATRRGWRDEEDGSRNVCQDVEAGE